MGFPLPEGLSLPARLAARRPPLVPAEGWAVLGLTLLAAVLRFHDLTGSSFWSDEGFTLQVVVVQRAAFLQGVLGDTHPPLYYLGLLGWSALFGQSEFALRAFGVLLSVLAVPVLHGIGRMLGGARVGLIAAGLLALSPLHVQYSAELRMYGLMVLAAAVLLWGATRFATAPGDAAARREGLWAYLAGCLLLLGTQMAGLFVIASGGLFMIAGWWLAGAPRAAVRPFLLAQAGLAVMLALAAPLYLTLIGNAPSLVVAARPTPGLIAEVIGSLLAQRLSDLLPRPVLAAIAAGVLGAVALGLWAARRRPLLLAFAGLVGALPFAFSLGVSFAIHPMFMTRIHVWALLPLYVVIAVGVVAFWQGIAGRAVLAALVVVQLAGITGYHVLWGRPDWRAAAAVITAGWQPGDRVLIPPAPGTEAVLRYYAPVVAGRVQFVHGPLDLAGLASPPGERRWVIGSPWHDRVPPAALAEALAPTLQPREEASFRLISVRLWEPR